MGFPPKKKTNKLFVALLLLLLSILQFPKCSVYCGVFISDKECSLNWRICSIITQQWSEGSWLRFRAQLSFLTLVGLPFDYLYFPKLSFISNNWTILPQVRVFQLKVFHNLHILVSLIASTSPLSLSLSHCLFWLFLSFGFPCPSWELACPAVATGGNCHARQRISRQAPAAPASDQGRGRRGKETVVVVVVDNSAKFELRTELSIGSSITIYDDDNCQRSPY